MTWLIVLLVIVLVILLIGSIRLGALAGYDSTGAWVRVRVGPARIKVFPLEKDPEKEEKKKKKKEAKKAKKAAKAEKKPKKEKPKPSVDVGGLFEMVGEILPAVNEASKKFRRKLQIDELTMDVTWADDDPADAAIRYGYAWAATEAILSFLENCFVIKKRNVTINLDYQLEKPIIWFRAGFSLTVGQLTRIGVPVGIKSLKAFLAYRKTLKAKQKALKAENANAAKGEQNNGKEPSCE